LSQRTLINPGMVSIKVIIDGEQYVPELPLDLPPEEPLELPPEEPPRFQKTGMSLFERPFHSALERESRRAIDSGTGDAKRGRESVRVVTVRNTVDNFIVIYEMISLNM
jgi:hypothetical protein